MAIDGCGDKAYVVTRHDQKVHEILDLKTTPTLGKSVSVGSEPTGIAITPNNTALYVTNWVDGTVMKIDTAGMTVASTIDLNKTLTDTGLLGAVTSRPSLAHPRALVITNDGDEDDTDERVFVTEWFAQRTEPEAANGSNADTSKKGLLYHFATADEMPATYDLPAVADAGFNDHNAAPTGCFPNQVGAVNVSGGFVFVTSTCASPKGPIGVFAGKNAGSVCTVITEAADCGALGGTCNPATLTCNPNTTDVKTTTHPAVTILNAETGAGSTTLLDAKFDALQNNFPKRMPLLPTDIDFINNFAYVTGFGTDAVFRMQVNAGAIGTAGSANNNFINLRKPMNDALIRMPDRPRDRAHAGVRRSSRTTARATSPRSTSTRRRSPATRRGDFRIAQSAGLPARRHPKDDKVLKGKRFFNTGLGRWSLRGEGWGACAACHVDGLTDNVTWYFARGPRQSTSLDGSFSKMDPSDQRIFNWTALFDEVADFEANTRGVSGGVGAIVSVANNPPMVSDRINTGAGNPPQQGLQGSSLATSLDPGALDDWLEITEYIKTIRSPRRPTNLVPADVTAGKALFGNAAQGNCIGCHSGSKWTVSKVFWPVGNVANAATADAAATSLSNISWNTALNGFPAALFPVTTPDATNTRMRFGAPPGAEQIQCILRPVGTFGISPAAVGVAELRQDMTTAAQGNAATGRGFNPPSLLGMQVGAPYFHAGNARTLEEVFDNLFTAHHQSAVAAVFSPTEAQKQQLAAYLLSIDKDEMAFNVPAKGASGGDICFYP